MTKWKIHCSRWLVVAVVGATVAYASNAFATWRECVPDSIYEVAPRSFQVHCSNGSSSTIPTWIVYRAGTSSSAQNEALAERFQSLVLATILAGRKFRADVVNDSTLCSGISDCQRADRWGSIP